MRSAALLAAAGGCCGWRTRAAPLCDLLQLLYGSGGVLVSGRRGWKPSVPYTPWSAQFGKE
jgi:hypothetical protein